MILKRLFFFAVMSLSACCTAVKMDSTGKTFRKGKDFLLVQFDCKTDVDDLQTVAALSYPDIRFHISPVSTIMQLRGLMVCKRVFMSLQMIYFNLLLEITGPMLITT